MEELTQTAEPTSVPRAHADRRKLRPGSKVILEDLGGRLQSPQLVRPEEMSSEGVWFEFDRFVYAGTACSLVVKTPTMAFMRMRGRVVTCDCPEAGRFTVGVRFQDRVDLDEIIGAAH